MWSKMTLSQFLPVLAAIFFSSAMVKVNTWSLNFGNSSNERTSKEMVKSKFQKASEGPLHYSPLMLEALFRTFFSVNF